MLININVSLCVQIDFEPRKNDHFQIAKAKHSKKKKKVYFKGNKHLFVVSSYNIK